MRKTPGTRTRWRRWVRWAALLPLSLLAGCRLYEAPIYKPLAPHGATQRILFIGNSLTYYNDLPGLVEQLSAGQAKPLQEDRVTVANATLEFHWDFSAARKHLDEGGWTFVMLQEYSTKPEEDPEGTLADYRLWGPEVKRYGAKPIIFENWPHNMAEGSAAATAGRMHDTYLKVQSEIGGEIAPIGPAWLRCEREHPEIKLFEDEKHPTVAGTYLTACVIIKTIYHVNAVGLPTVVEGLKLDPQTAAVLQKIADEK